MKEKNCDLCRWYRPIVTNGWCMNPLNDRLYDYFNPTNGQIVDGLRRPMPVDRADWCPEFEKLKLPRPPK